MNIVAKIVGVLAIFGAGLDIDDSTMPPERDYGRICLALVGFSEARDQPDEGLAVAMQVVLNRATDPANRWPKTLCDVALQRGQFIGLEQWPVPRNPERIDSAGWQRSLEMADQVIAGTAAIPNECARATGFNQDVPRADAHVVCRIGAHTFYAEPPAIVASISTGKTP